MGRQDQATERNYKAHSKSYDKQRFEGKKNQYLELVRKDAFFALMPKDLGFSVLDVGCGTGRGAVMIAQKVYSVFGIDYTSEMLQKAKKKRQSLVNVTLSFGQGNAKVLPFKDSTFDCVVSFNFIHMFGIEPQQQLINEMSRVLKPGGNMIIEFDNYYKGLVLGAKIQREKKRTHCNKPSDFKILFAQGELEVDKVHGAVLPIVWRFFQHLPSCFLYFERISRVTPFRYLAERCYVRATKK